MMKKFQKWIVLVSSWQLECNSCHWAVHLKIVKMLNFMSYMSHQCSSVQSLSHVRLFATPWITACQASLSITNSQSLLRLMPIESVMPSSHLILCRPLLLLPPIPPSIRVFSNESLHWKWSLFTWGGQSIGVSASTSMNTKDRFPSGWTGWISLQSKGLSRVFSNTTKASIFQLSAFFTVQLSHPYMTTGKTIALTRWTFVWQSSVSAF